MLSNFAGLGVARRRRLLPALHSRRGGTSGRRPRRQTDRCVVSRVGGEQDGGHGRRAHTCIGGLAPVRTVSTGWSCQPGRHSPSSLCFCSWNSAFVSTPWGRRSASLASVGSLLRSTPSSTPAFALNGPSPSG